jgi:hypothetical protein
MAVLGGNAVFLIAGRDGSDRPAWPWGWLLQPASAAALSLRHRHPRSALAITGSAALLYYPLGVYICRRSRRAGVRPGGYEVVARRARRARSL